VIAEQRAKIETLIEEVMRVGSESGVEEAERGRQAAESKCVALEERIHRSFQAEELVRLPYLQFRNVRAVATSGPGSGVWEVASVSLSEDGICVFSPETVRRKSKIWTRNRLLKRQPLPLNPCPKISNPARIP